MQVVTRILAVIGAIALVCVAVGGLIIGMAWWNAPASPATNPKVPAAAGAAGPTAAPAPLQGDDFWVHGVDLTSPRVRTARGDLLDVRVVAGGAGATQTGMHGRNVGVDATVPFATVEKQIGQGISLRPAPDGRVLAIANIRVLGRDLPIEALGAVSAQEGLLVVRPVRLRVAGSGFFDAVLGEVARRTLTISQPVPGLPEGLALQTIQVRDDGFRVHVVGKNVVGSR